MTVRIIELSPAADLPNAEELDRLLAMVAEKYRVLACPADADQASHRRQFAAAIEFLCYVFRPGRINSAYAASVWVDLCREWMNKRIYPAEMTLRPFVAAVVASGIKHEPLDQFPFALNFAISLGSASRPSSAWRASLNGIPEPVAPRRPRPRVAETNIASPGDRERTSW